MSLRSAEGYNRMRGGGRRLGWMAIVKAKVSVGGR